MRILYFSRDYTPHDHRFLSALVKSEHQVYYLRLEQQNQPFETRPLPPEIELIEWSGGKSLVSAWQLPGLLFDLKRLLKKVNPHLVHAGPIQRSAFLVALSGFKPLLGMSWGYDLIQDAKRNFFWNWATRYTLKKSDWLIGDCETIRKIAISYGMPADRITTFPWGIDLEHFSPKPVSMDNPETNHFEKPLKYLENTSLPFTLISTRNWEPIYGVDTLARAFVLASREDPGLQLVMLGSGSQADLLKDIFSSAGLISSPGLPESSSKNSRVVFPGHVNYEKLPACYQSSDLYLAATHSDGTSISLLEAMACGLPVLVSDIDGNREWVNHGVNGWLIPEGDVDAMAQAILNAVRMRSQLSVMGREGRKTVEQRANWKLNSQKLLDVYQHVYQDFYRC